MNTKLSQTTWKLLITIRNISIFILALFALHYIMHVIPDSSWKTDDGIIHWFWWSPAYYLTVAVLHLLGFMITAISLFKLWDGDL